MTTKLPFLSDDHHFAIANVAVHSATLDQTIDRLVYLTILPHSVAEFLVKNTPPDRLVEILRLTFVAELAQHSALIDALFGQIKKSRSDRNHVLHWLHESTEKPDVVRFARFADKRGGRKASPKDYTASDIQKIADTMAESSGELLDWWNLYNWRCAARWRDTPEPPTAPPHFPLPKSLRQLSKSPPRGRQPRKRPK